MITSQVGINLIKSLEGFRGKAYYATTDEQKKNRLTIGYGHSGSDVTPNETITYQQAEEMLKNDVKKFENTINQNVRVGLTQNQFDALVSFVYNVGSSAFTTSTLLQKLNNRDYTGASNELLLWNHQNGKVLAGLTLRRKAEKVLFDTNTPKPKEHIINYTIKKDDTLWKIALDYHTTVERLMKLNTDIKNQNIVIAGKSIKVPKVY